MSSFYFCHYFMSYEPVILQYSYLRPNGLYSVHRIHCVVCNFYTVYINTRYNFYKIAVSLRLCNIPINGNTRIIFSFIYLFTKKKKNWLDMSHNQIRRARFSVFTLVLARFFHSIPFYFNIIYTLYFKTNVSIIAYKM